MKESGDHRRRRVAMIVTLLQSLFVEYLFINIHLYICWFLWPLQSKTKTNLNFLVTQNIHTSLRKKTMILRLHTTITKEKTLWSFNKFWEQIFLWKCKVISLKNFYVAIDNDTCSQPSHGLAWKCWILSIFENCSCLAGL